MWDNLFKLFLCSFTFQNLTPPCVDGHCLGHESPFFTIISAPTTAYAGILILFLMAWAFCVTA